MNKKPKSATTMADLARLAGVHVSTVSRALADSPLVEQSVRKRILKLASQHGYVVNSTARNLRAGRTQTLSVVIPLAHETGQGLTDPFFSSLLGHLADEITEKGYGMLLQKVVPPMDHWFDQLAASRRSDGIIVIGQSTEHKVLQAAALSNVPFVVWGGHLRGQNYCVVGTDNVGAARMVTEHLLRLGRRRIVFIGDPASPEIRLRCEGYEQALAHGPAGTAKPMIVKAHLTPDAAYQATLEHLRTGRKFDAVFAASDVIAISAMRALSSSGIAIPEQVAVVGFDGIELGAHVHPALTTLRQDLTRGAKLLVAQLLRRIAGEAVESVKMPGELIVRESCGESR